MSPRNVRRPSDNRPTHNKAHHDAPSLDCPRASRECASRSEGGKELIGVTANRADGGRYLSFGEARRGTG
jgi:hypothetical protein